MDQEKPKDIEQYRRWLRGERGVHLATAFPAKYYDSAVHHAKREFGALPFWAALGPTLDEANAEYYTQSGYPLLHDTQVPEIDTKSYEALIEKTYRKNVLDNPKWPDPPDDGWLVPPSWMSRVRDALRTRLVVTYLDGVEFLADRLQALTQEHGLDCSVDYEAREEGYYAVHVYVTPKLEIPRLDWDTERISFPIEIQIHTLLQQTITRMLHRYYEHKRLATAVPRKAWQWDYTSDEFATAYVGHVLHYVEAAIVGIRKRQKEETEP